MTTFDQFDHITGQQEQRELSRWHRFDLLMLREMLETKSLSVPAERVSAIAAQVGYDPRGYGGFVRLRNSSQEASYWTDPMPHGTGDWHLTETGYRIILQSLAWAESTLNLIEPGDGGLEDMG